MSLDDKDNKLEVDYGSGNVFQDLGMPDSDVKQLKTMIAGKIIDAMDRDKLSIRKAEALSHYPAADFSRVRNARISGFTIDKLVNMLNGLGRSFEVEKVKVRKIPVAHAAAPRTLAAGNN
jgi:predicted XRE-type DNA-binding protein